MKTVTTVLGEMPTDELGITMPHEHIICDVSLHSGNPDNRLTDIELAARELTLYRKAGGTSMVDVTPSEMGRDAAALKRVSELSGVNIIMSTGYYDENCYPEHVLAMTVTELASHMVAEATEGIDGTGIRSGVIGELRSNNSSITTEEEKVLQAAAAAHKETGMAITLHSGYGRPAPAQLAILVAENVPADRIIAGHADIEWSDTIAADIDYYRSLLDTGAYLEFDTIGWQDFMSEQGRLDRISRLIEIGYSDRLLLSSDLCRQSFYHVNGGRGYDYVLSAFVPQLSQRGVTETQIDAILVQNPARVLGR